MDEATRVARRMAVLEGLGFERVETSPVETECIRVGGGRFRTSAVRPSMGTLVSITAIHPSVGQAHDAMGRAFEEMDRVVDLLNRYDPASAVALLSTEGMMKLPPPELTRVVSLGRDYLELSGGAFDITVQPLVDLFRTGKLSRPAGHRPPGRSANGDPPHPSTVPPPTEAEVREALELVDGRAVKVDSRSITLAKGGMGLTLDGIAKGYVVDLMARGLESGGIRDFLINAGGDIRTGGRREDGKPWRVAVQNPRKDGTYPDVLAVRAGAVATSGSYEIYFDGERTRHHIVSGRTGSSPQPTQSVTVIAPTTVAADALATAVFVMGPESGLRLIDSLPDCACFIIDEADRQFRSRKWRSAHGDH